MTAPAKEAKIQDAEQSIGNDTKSELDLKIMTTELHEKCV